MRTGSDSGSNLERRVRAVERARVFIDAHLSESLRVEMLCEVADMPYRTLHRSFQETLGMSPLQFIKTRRLAKIRTALVSADARRVTVARVALDHGFGHLGRFSREYRRAFGESPSSTLQLS